MDHPKTGINLAAISKAMEVTDLDMDTIKQSTDTRMLLRNATLVVFGGLDGCALIREGLILYYYQFCTLPDQPLKAVIPYDEIREMLMVSVS